MMVTTLWFSLSNKDNFDREPLGSLFLYHSHADGEPPTADLLGVGLVDFRHIIQFLLSNKGDFYYI